MIQFLRTLSLTHCACGAADCVVHPLLLSLAPEAPLCTGRDALDALKARDFKSEHISSLDEVVIPYPGYHPDSGNDEVHTDASEQYIFSHGEDADDTTIVHDQLRAFVVDRKLWYVLLHTTPKPSDGFSFSERVILFAVGAVPGLPYGVGVVTHQMCHNLCD